jgi:hypothetical protein
MAKINDYYQKKQMMEKLAGELSKLEEDQSLKVELEFENKVRELMSEYDKTPKDFIEILSAIDPSIANPQPSGSGLPKRAMKVYKNPHTGEVVRTRGGNHKTLNEWREQHGKATVKTWQEEDD